MNNTKTNVYYTTDILPNDGSIRYLVRSTLSPFVGNVLQKGDLACSIHGTLSPNGKFDTFIDVRNKR